MEAERGLNPYRHAPGVPVNDIAFAPLSSVVPETLDAAPARDADPAFAALARVEREMLRLLDGERSVLAAAIREHLETGGKRLRARLALAAGLSLGASVDALIPWAAACELLHNASLVHDDLQDGDTHRRGRPTTWVRFGMEQAINAGDLLLMLPYELVAAVPVDDARRWRLCRALASHAAETVRGQSAEMELDLAQGVDRPAWHRVVEGKTSALLALPVLGAAIIAGWSVEDAEALAQEFRPLGLLFQLQDDVVDLYGEKGRDRRGCDLYEGKVSALVVAHLSRCPEDAERLILTLRSPREQTSETDVSWCMRRFEERGTLGAVLDEIIDLADAAAASPRLARFPALRAVAMEIVDRSLAPIEALVALRRTHRAHAAVGASMRP